MTQASLLGSFSACWLLEEVEEKEKDDEKRRKKGKESAI